MLGRFRLLPPGRVVSWLTVTPMLFALHAWGQTPSASTRLPRFVVVGQDWGDAADVEGSPLVLSRELAEDAKAPAEGPVRWLDLRGNRLSPGTAPPQGGVRLQAFEPGAYSIPLKQGSHTLVVVRAVAVDAAGRATERAAVTRSLPVELRFSATANKTEQTQRLVVAGLGSHLPRVVTVVSIDAAGNYSDSLPDVPLTSAACPKELVVEDEDLDCARTPPIRISTDLADRKHPSVAGRALLGSVGGRLVFRLANSSALALPVLAPRELERDGPGRYRVQLRASIVRTFSKGPPAVGENDAEAIDIVRKEIASASRIWGQCGVRLDVEGEAHVRVVDPPRLSMITVGAGRGLPASGGSVELVASGVRLYVRTRVGEPPVSVAGRLAAAARKRGLNAAVHRNARPYGSALSSFDVVLTDRRGHPVTIEGNDGVICDDTTLSVRQVELDLADGLDHFNDFNASTGTPEERYLLRALTDGDPATVDLIVVPVFGGMGRIGESFIHTQGGSLQSALILDRTGVRAGARSFTLAHELGHILLDLPGHPDDFGVDTPSSLMDADAADSTIFGPRRLSLEDCRRALRQSGRDAPVPMILDDPLDEKSGTRGAR